LSRLPGHDLSLQGLAGFMEVKADPDTLPSVPNFQAGDYAAATYATIGILAAYIRRQNTGQGCFLDVPIYDSLMSLGGCTLSSALARLAGSSGLPSLGSFGTNPRYATYKTRDNKAVTVSLLETRTWHLFCKYIGRSDLIYDESWKDRHSTHGEYEQKFRAAISDFCLQHDRDDLVRKMHDAEIPICAIYTDDEAVNSPEAKAREIVAFRENGRDGAVPYFRDPLQRAGLADPTRLPAPALGENSEEIRQRFAANKSAMALKRSQK
jgi:CoA:oxalate CoA-transferase